MDLLTETWSRRTSYLMPISSSRFQTSVIPLLSQFMKALACSRQALAPCLTRLQSCTWVRDTKALKLTFLPQASFYSRQSHSVHHSMSPAVVTNYTYSSPRGSMRLSGDCTVRLISSKMGRKSYSRSTSKICSRGWCRSTLADVQRLRKLRSIRGWNFLGCKTQLLMKQVGGATFSAENK